MKCKNEEVNKIISEQGLKRIGKCNPEKCQSACCRINVNILHPTYSSNRYYLDDITSTRKIQKINQHWQLKITPRICRNLTTDGRCTLHDKRTQPRVCRLFPMSPRDGVYMAVKKYCGFKFIKIKKVKK